MGEAYKDHEAAYWINAGWEDYQKGLMGPQVGRYGKEERIYAQCGFDLAKAGYQRVDVSEPKPQEEP